MICLPPLHLVPSTGANWMNGWVNEWISKSCSYQWRPTGQSREGHREENKREFQSQSSFMGNWGWTFIWLKVTQKPWLTWDKIKHLPAKSNKEPMSCRRQLHNSLETCGIVGFETKRKWWYNLKKKKKKWACLLTFLTPRSRKTG